MNLKKNASTIIRLPASSDFSSTDSRAEKIKLLTRKSKNFVIFKWDAGSNVTNAREMVVSAFAYLATFYLTPEHFQKRNKISILEKWTGRTGKEGGRVFLISNSEAEKEQVIFY